MPLWDIFFCMTGRKTVVFILGIIIILVFLASSCATVPERQVPVIEDLTIEDDEERVRIVENAEDLLACVEEQLKSDDL